MKIDEQAIRSTIREILNGIDKEETDGGWWETSTGAEFGRKKLCELEDAVVALLSAPRS